MSTVNLFDPLPQDKQDTMLAHHMPTGDVWKAAFDKNSNLGKFIKGFSIEIYRLQVIIKKIIDELDINITDDLLPDWEQSVGIPDHCFFIGVNKDKRRQQVIQKLSDFGGVQLAADFVRVAAFFDITITVAAGAAVHTIEITITAATGNQFPLPFPIPFETGAEEFLSCIFEDLAPANVDVIFI